MMREDASAALGVASKKEFFAIFHRARNFFKHADRDAEETLPTFGNGDNDFALAVFQFGEIAYRTMPMWAYLVWFYATHPEFPVPERLEQEVAPHRHASSPCAVGHRPENTSRFHGAAMWLTCRQERAGATHRARRPT